MSKMSKRLCTALCIAFALAIAAGSQPASADEPYAFGNCWVHVENYHPDPEWLFDGNDYAFDVTFQPECSGLAEYSWYSYCSWERGPEEYLMTWARLYFNDTPEPFDEVIGYRYAEIVCDGNNPVVAYTYDWFSPY